MKSLPLLNKSLNYFFGCVTGFYYIAWLKRTQEK